MRYILSIIMMVVAMTVTAQVSVFAPQSELPDAESDSLTVSLITKYPAAEIYQLYGHEAIRVKSAKFDVAFDYGLFDFDSPNFVYRFVKGETDYLTGCHDFNMFMLSCLRDGAKVVEQRLNLTQEEAHKLLALLNNDVLPQNRRYRYNYVKNNCSTKVIDKLDEAVGYKIDYDDSVRYGTYREELRHYDRNYSWYQFGIDLILGSGLDYELTRREELFVPVELMHSAEDVVLPNGRRLVAETKVIYEGQGDMTLPATPWYLTPMMIACLILALSLIVAYLSLRRKKIYRAVYMVWFTMIGMAGVLVAFMVIVSQHEATSPNVMIWWLNPLAFIVPAMVWKKGVNKVLSIYMLLNASMLLGLVIGIMIGSQSINPAVVPLMLTTIVLSATYFIVASKSFMQIKVSKQ